VAIPPGLLITAILVVNNLRDIDTDRAAGKHTLAVRLGVRGSRTEYVTLLVGAYLVPLVGWLAGRFDVLPLLPLITVPMALPLIGTLQTHHEDGPVMNRALAATARLALVYCVLFAIGLAV
jgi:1,4-dihydroxy-2-naphthoate octaprenyltransferase